ncbi:MAG: alpha/beta hydrolase [Planctomycetaceae bacterium]|jgi:acetyl esterase/lipase|nr:alpha/beta hydrolase [Planctomycetaceae bacterium]
MLTRPVADARIVGEVSALAFAGVLVAVLSLAENRVFAVGPEALPLWAEGAPHAKGSDESDTPTVRAYLPQELDGGKATGAGVVICPGGGYGILAMDHEGHQLAKWFQKNGVAGFVLRYRHSPKYRHPVPMEDAQRAIRYVRAKAEIFGVDAGRIGIMGFSAGGHLSSTVATHFDAGNPEAKDVIDRLSCRPDFAVLCYPVVSLTAPYAHKGSGRNLFGPDADEQTLRTLSNDLHVTAETPPTFLFHTAEDKGVNVQNSLDFFMALKKVGVPSEMHIYQDGPHGIGMAPADPAVFGWKDRLLDWMRASGFLNATARAEVSGRIKVNDEDLRWGMIALAPLDPNKPRAWTMVSRGKYSIPASRGAALGENVVEIYDLGGVEPRPTREDFQRIDPNGVLRLNVVEGKNEFDLNLTQ